MKKIVVQTLCGGHLTALVEDNRIHELVYDSTDNNSISGNIYMGIVSEINIGGFAFVDIGASRRAFLQFNDARERHLFHKSKLQLKSGQALAVQVLKDASKYKGTVVTSSPAFSGNLLVLEKSIIGERITLSKKIIDNTERARLKRIVEKFLPSNIKAIIRTEAEGCNEAELAAEMEQLINHIRFTNEHSMYLAPPCLVYEPEKGWKKTVRQLAGKEQIEVNFYEKNENGMATLGLVSQIEEVFEKKVNLKSGANLIIEETEVCHVIDVNSGAFSTKKADDEDAFLTVNLEAASEAARQIRLRNLSGIILVDFIRMRDNGNKNKTLAAFEAELKKDRIPVNFLGMTRLGLVEISRKRIRPTLSSFPGADKAIFAKSD